MVDTFSGTPHCLERLVLASAYRVDAVCLELGCSSRYLHTMFLRDIGLPPKQWMNYERMVLARRKLEGGKSSEQVAHDLGYVSPHTFCKQFQKHHFITPARFARKLQRFHPPLSPGKSKGR